MPKVTVAMPVYNDAPYVREAVDSILSQSLRDFELLIVDDGSTDGTADIIAGYADTRIRIVRFDKNRGRPFARNAALDAAQGQYLAWMDADDISPPQRLERQIAFLDTRPDVTVCSGAVQCFHERRDVVHFPEDAKRILANVVWEPPLCNAASCLRLSHIHTHSLRYDESLLRAEDYGFWADLLLATPLKIVNLPDILLNWRYFHRPTSPVYHAKATQRVLHSLGLPADERSAQAHTIFSCSSYEGMPNIDAEEVLACVDAVYKAVLRHDRIVAPLFLTTAHIKAEKFLSLIHPFWPALRTYRSTALGQTHPLGRLLAMVAARRCYAPVKALRAGFARRS